MVWAPARAIRGEAALLDSGHRPEDHPIDLSALTTNSLAPLVGVLALLVLVAFVALGWQARRIGRLQARLDRVTRGADGSSLEAVLDAHLDKVFAVAGELDELSARAAVLEANARRAFSRVGLVRYNPFEDTGGNQSFALTLLDANANGIVISSLHSRSGTRMYAKLLTAGRADGALSSEEEEALGQALAERGGSRAGSREA